MDDDRLQAFVAAAALMLILVVASCEAGHSMGHNEGYWRGVAAAQEDSHE